VLGPCHQLRRDTPAPTGRRERAVDLADAGPRALVRLDPAAALGRGREAVGRGRCLGMPR